MWIEIIGIQYDLAAVKSSFAQDSLIIKSELWPGISHFVLHPFNNPKFTIFAFYGEKWNP